MWAFAGRAGGAGSRSTVSHRGPLTRTFLWPYAPQGLFFDDSYGFYPGQVLIGPAKIFSSVQWLSGVKPVLSTKSKFRVVVEEVCRWGRGRDLDSQNLKLRFCPLQPAPQYPC